MMVIGSAIGVLGGWLIARHQYSKAFRAERILAFEGLWESLGNVSRLVDQAKRQLTEDLDKDGIPNFSLDVSSMLHRINKSEPYLPKKLWVTLDGLRYQAEHLNIKISGLYFTAISLGSQKALESPEFESVLVHCGKMKEWIHAAVVEVEEEKEKYQK